MKNVFNRELINTIAHHLLAQQPDFDSEHFKKIASDKLDERELKDRANQICLALKDTLPEDYPSAVKILINTLQPVTDNQEIGDLSSDHTGLAGWVILPFSQYVGELGQEHFDDSMKALYEMTKRFSSEFGIRYFLITQQQNTLAKLRTWLTDPCHHVRRLISEGTRPLLPWAMQLPEIKQFPETILSLLEALKDDESEYVRRSVANNLNDIAKDHPDLVADIAHQWLVGANNNRQRLVKHACRTLIKQGHSKTLSAFGYSDTKNIQSKLLLSSTEMQLGQSLQLSATLTNNSDADTKILLDYVIYHQKANGKLTPKVFKWKEFSLKAGETVELVKKHVIKPITTRKYYAGEHKAMLQVNGKETVSQTFNLTV